MLVTILKQQLENKLQHLPQSLLHFRVQFLITFYLPTMVGTKTVLVYRIKITAITATRVTILDLKSMTHVFTFNQGFSKTFTAVDMVICLPTAVETDVSLLVLEDGAGADPLGGGLAACEEIV